MSRARLAHGVALGALLWSLLSSLVGAGVAGCAERPLTQLVVVADSDLAIPAQLDAVEIEITPPTGLPVTRSGTLGSATELPATLGIVHRGGPLGPVAIAVRGEFRGLEVVTRLAEVEMVAGRTLVVELSLEAACVAVPCPDGQTCARGACRDVRLRPEELPEFDGSVPRLGDGGAECFPELCNGIDDDCDTRVDEGVDTSGDPRNCGVCGNACPARPRAQPACAEGRCALDCEEGWGDCNGDVRDGCEEPLNTLSMCGVCGVECAIAHGVSDCSTGSCEIGRDGRGDPLCAPGWGDCNGDPSDGCEAPLNSVEDCGVCDAGCMFSGAAASCTGGLCAIAGCDPGRDDCDGNAANGCETPLDTVTDCGACGRACPAGVANGDPVCVSGACDVTCDAGWADCDGSGGNGCETPLDSTTDCGGCGRRCELPRATEACTATGCALVACDAGWGDCDGDPTNGCETPLDTIADCGACGATCTGADPVCTDTAGARRCGTTCSGSTILCGGTCADTDTSTAHCGGCGRACAPANAIGRCAAGSCGIEACAPGFDDCNGDPADGCETRLDTLTSCGACGARCELPGATEACMGGRCVIATCEAGVGDCDGLATNGCETPLDTLTSCGACGARCDLPGASETCETGLCKVYLCEMGRADCNALSGDGCEVALGSLTDCRACGDRCDVPRATESCATGTCAATRCDDGWADCNGMLADGCERSLATTTDCGACGVACGPFPNATASCVTGSCARTCLAGWADCNGVANDGCETSLQDATHCGSCTTVCGGARPFCADTMPGVFACSASCATGRTRCGDSCVDLATSASHCGMCDRPCAPPNATGACLASECLVSSCDPGWADCNGMAADGCERDVRTLTDCGGCDVTCGPTFPNATATCETGFCSLLCTPGFGDCDGMRGNGCENPLSSVMSCGGCATVCPTPANSSRTCVDDMCSYTCATNRADCDGLASNGCEVNTSTSLLHCGGCDRPCGTRCVSGVCAS
jgi:hypothetical protein